MTLNSTASHNSCYVEKNITSYFDDGSIWDRIAGTNGYEPFEGIFPGCTITMSRKVLALSKGGGSAGGGDKLLVLGCNCHYNIGDGDNVINYNHITVCPVWHFGNSKMNSTETTVGGYKNSFMNTEIIGPTTTTGNTSGTINEQLYAEFGNHLKAYREYVSSSIDNTIENRLSHDSNRGILGATNACEWIWVQAVLMTEVEVYGSIVYSASGWDTGSGNFHFPAFIYNKQNVRRTEGVYWLRDVASGNSFCNSGIIATAYQAIHPLALRPRFLLA